MSRPISAVTAKAKPTPKARPADKPPVSQRTKARPPSLIHYVYEPFPSPINCTTLPATRDIAADKSHPYHIRTRRRLAAFDKDKLHWRVHCALDISKKSFIRDWAARRVRWAVERELKGQGSAQTQTQIGEGSADGAETALGQQQAASKYRDLKGALLLILAKDKTPLTASNEDVEKSVKWVLEQVLFKFKAAHGGRR